MDVPDVVRAHCWLTNVVKDVSRIYFDEVVYGNELTRNERRPIPEPMLRSVELMNKVGWKFSKL